MPAPPLQTICIEKTCSFLERGMWDNCERNPFSFMPPSVIDNLLSYMLPAGSQLIESKTIHSRLLLTSGRLQHVDLERSGGLQKPYHALLFRMLSRGCRNLRTLRLPIRHPPGRTLPELLENCANLEELLSPVCFDPYHLRNCKKLKIVRLHLRDKAAMQFFCSISPDRLQGLASLEVIFCSARFHPTTKFDKERLLSITVKILDICPRLISLGYLDSAEAINEIHGRDGRTLKTARHFELKRCSWIINKDIPPMEFCDVIRVAALSCPLVEILEIHVRYANCLKYLKVLNKLTTLILILYPCEDEYEHELFSTLNEIGPQLHQLFIVGPAKKLLRPHLVDDDNSYLESFQFLCGMSPKESPVRFLDLKYLVLYGCDRKILFTLLSNSIHLKKLRLGKCMALDDALLDEILRKNFFSELEVVSQIECSLSKLGLERFVRSARKLIGLYSVSSPLIDDHEVELCLRSANPGLLLDPKH